MKNTPSPHGFPFGLGILIVSLLLLVMVARANIWFFEDDVKEHIQHTWGGASIVHSFTSRRFIDNSVVSLSINGETVHFCIDANIFGSANVQACK